MQRYINEELLTDVCSRYEIDQKFADYFRILINYKIVIIADDSGSMNQKSGPNDTRWSELCSFIKLVFSITETIQNSFIDLFFLNRGGITGIQTLESIVTAFANPPKGPTPIVPILRHVLQQSYTGYSGRIIIIATDGEPTDSYNRVNTKELYDVLMNERSSNDFVTFLACTDDDRTIDYLNNWDRIIPRVDVVDDYFSERTEILRAQGQNFHFSYGEYVIKTMAGSLVPELDVLDEPQKGNRYRTTRESDVYDDSCCEIL